MAYFLLYLSSCEELADVCNGGGKCIGDDAAPSFGIITEDAGAWNKILNICSDQLELIITITLRRIKRTKTKPI